MCDRQADPAQAEDADAGAGDPPGQRRHPALGPLAAPDEPVGGREPAHHVDHQPDGGVRDAVGEDVGGVRDGEPRRGPPRRRSRRSRRRSSRPPEPGHPVEVLARTPQTPLVTATSTAPAAAGSSSVERYGAVARAARLQLAAERPDHHHSLPRPRRDGRQRRGIVHCRSGIEWRAMGLLTGFTTILVVIAADGAGAHRGPRRSLAARPRRDRLLRRLAGTAGRDDQQDRVSAPWPTWWRRRPRWR